MDMDQQPGGTEGDDKSSTNEGMAEHRQAIYKSSGRGSEDLRRRRSNVCVELRKARKDAELEKRRQISFRDVPDQVTGEKPDASTIQRLLEQIWTKLSSGIEKELREGLQIACRMVDYGNYPPLIAELIQADLVPKFAESLLYPNDDIRFEAATIIANMTSEELEYIEYIAPDEQGVVHGLWQALHDSNDKELWSRIIWALGNLACIKKTRDLLIEVGLFDKFVQLGHTPVPIISVYNSARDRRVALDLLRTIIWSIVQFLSDRPVPASAQLEKLIPMICHFLEQDDRDLTYYSAIALRSATWGRDEIVQAVLRQGPSILSRLASLLKSTDAKIVDCCTYVLWKMTGKSHDNRTQLEALVQSKQLVTNAVGVLTNSDHENDTVRYAVDIIGDVEWEFGITSQIYELKIPAELMKLFEKDIPSLQAALTLTLLNIICNSSAAEVMYLSSIGATRALCAQLKSRDNPAISHALEAIDEMLKKCESAAASDERARITQEIEECGGLNSVETLQMNMNPTISDRAVAIMDKFMAEGTEMDIGDDPNTFGF